MKNSLKSLFGDLIQYSNSSKRALARLFAFNKIARGKILWLVCVFLLLALSGFLAFGSSYQELAKIQQNPNNVLQEFSTDGCSGGMSSSWRFLATTAPSIGTKEPEYLPWLSCCLAHDESYWRGGSKKQRLLADQALMQCVRIKGFPFTANVMYAAVRLGGGPCTGFSWRWGYGWQDC